LFFSQSNTNKIDKDTYDRIKKDIFKRGFLDPNIYVASDGEIISGNHRVRIAKELGIGFEQQLKIHNMGNLNVDERFRISEMFNTRGSADETLRAISFYKIYQHKALKELNVDKIIFEKNIVKQLSDEYIYTEGQMKRYIEIGCQLLKNYPWLINEVDGKIITNLHLWYLVRLNKTKRIYSGDELKKDDKEKLIEEVVVWLKREYKKNGKTVGVDNLQAELRKRLVKEFKVKLPELTDVPWASIWYPTKRVESIRHIIEDEVDGWHAKSGRLTQLGTYKRDLLKMTRDTRVSSFHMSIAFNLIRLLSRDYNRGEQKFDKFKIVDPCCGRGIRVVTGLFMNHEAYGYDVSPNVINLCHESYPEYIDNFMVHDTTKSIPHDDNSIDLIFSCPPYWMIEKYENVNGQLSSYKTYKEFLLSYEQMILESVRVSKKWIVFVVANFRHASIYYPFCFDTERLFYKCGVFLFDKIILGHDLSKPTGGNRSIINNHTRTAHDEMFIFKHKNP
jgi:hypothetical protein